MSNILDIRISRDAKEAGVSYSTMLDLLYEARMFTEVDEYITYYKLWSLVYSNHEYKVRSTNGKS